MPACLSRIQPKLYAHRFDLLFASLLGISVINILFPDDIYNGFAQTLCLPFQLFAGAFLFDVRRRRLFFAIAASIGALLGTGRLLDTLTAYNMEKALAFLYVLFFGWVMLEVFRQLHTAKMVDRENVLAALCGLLLIGYCGFFVFVAVELHRPGSFAGLAPGAQNLRDLFYYSYVTILTIGYGDITPQTWAAQNATLLVALTGYMYSLVVVAMIVSQFAGNKKARKLIRISRLSGDALPRALERKAAELRKSLPPAGRA